VEDIPIPEAQDDKTVLLELRGPSPIRFTASIGMMAAINLNSESSFDAQKVENVPPARHLSLEFQSHQAAIWQPRFSFRFGGAGVK
jgi:hypothetical protein